MKKQVFQFAGGLLIFALSLMIVLFVPPLSMLYIPLCLGVFCTLNLSEGKWQSILLLIIGFSGTLLLSGSLLFAALFMVIPFLFSGIATRFFAKEMPEKTLTFVFGLANAVFFASVICFTKDELSGIDTIFAQFTDNFSQNLDIFVQQGLIDTDFKNDYIALLNNTLAYFKRMIPSMLFVFSASLGYISVWICYFIAKLLKAEFVFKPAFSRFKCNTVTTGLTILVCLLSIFIKDGVLGIALDNLYNIFSFLLCVCTASLADYLMKSKKWLAIVRIIIVFFLVSNYSGSIISLLMCLIAITDARADFRRLEH